mgnify:CR=1 FL=1
MGIARGVHVFLGFVLFINCIVRVIMAFFVKSAPDGGTPLPGHGLQDVAAAG